MRKLTLKIGLPFFYRLFSEANNLDKRNIEINKISQCHDNIFSFENLTSC